MNNYIKDKLVEFDNRFCRRNRAPDQLGRPMDTWFFPETLTPREVKTFFAQSLIDTYSKGRSDVIKEFNAKPIFMAEKEMLAYKRGYEAGQKADEVGWGSPIDNDPVGEIIKVCQENRNDGELRMAVKDFIAEQKNELIDKCVVVLENVLESSNNIDRLKQEIFKLKREKALLGIY